MSETVLYPFIFKPIFQERIWGGRELEKLYQKPLPPGKKIGESWEIADRPGAESEIANGAFAGKTLRWLMTQHRKEVMGDAPALHGRFPLLIKILDAREKLSLQVHPPESKAAKLGGEPKTEMWYVTQADPGAELYVGLKSGVTAKEFTRRIEENRVVECFHRVEMRAGDAMYLPSGRVHAIGAGLVLFEIQQNSDTTYRVFDWNRVDDAGKPRQLHIEESLESIDFDDFEPEPLRGENWEADSSSVKIRPLVENPLFSVEVVDTSPEGLIDYQLRAPRIVGVVRGRVLVQHSNLSLELKAGDFCLLPAALNRVKFCTPEAAEYLVVEPGFGE
jgi:mannose-6-phosphate isomerase